MRQSFDSTAPLFEAEANLTGFEADSESHSDVEAAEEESKRTFRPLPRRYKAAWSSEERARKLRNGKVLTLEHDVIEPGDVDDEVEDTEVAGMPL